MDINQHTQTRTETLIVNMTRAHFEDEGTSARMLKEEEEEQEINREKFFFRTDSP